VVGDLINIRGHNALAVIVALVEVEIALVLTAELEDVIPVNQGEIIAQRMILAIPESLPNILCVHVVRDQRVSRFAANLDRAAHSGSWGRGGGGAQSQIIPKIVVMKIIG